MGCNYYGYIRDRRNIRLLTRQLHHVDITTAEQYRSGIEVNRNCSARSKADSRLGRIAFTGFTKSSGLMEVLSLLAHETGFEPISMDVDTATCTAPDQLFLYSTLPRSVFLCPVVRQVVMIHNPEEVIRREYLNVVTPSLAEIKKSWRPFAKKHVTLWAKYIDQWIRHAKGELVFQCFEQYLVDPTRALESLFSLVELNE